MVILRRRLEEEEDRSWEPLATLGGTGGEFGVSLSGSGNLLAVGAAADNAVHLYRLESTTNWTFVQTLAFDDDRFGRSCALEGTNLAVGSVNSTYVFARQDDTDGPWTFQQKLEVANGTASEFGATVSLSASWLAVGAPGAGRAYVYRQEESTWVLDAELAGEDEDGRFGASCALATNADVVVCGAPRDDSCAGDCEGIAHVYALDDDGEWTREASLPTNGIAAGQYFGSTCAVSADGTVAVVGDSSSEMTLIFRGVGGTWFLEDSVESPKSGGSESFGRATGILGDVLVVGAQGTACIFESGTTTETWFLAASLEPETSSPRFGTALALADNFVAVGAPDAPSYDEDGFLVADSGAVFAWRPTSDPTYNPSWWQPTPSSTIVPLATRPPTALPTASPSISLTTAPSAAKPTLAPTSAATNFHPSASPTLLLDPRGSAGGGGDGGSGTSLSQGAFIMIVVVIACIIVIVFTLYTRILPCREKPIQRWSMIRHRATSSRRLDARRPPMM